MADTTRRLALHRPTGGDPAAVPADLARVTDQLDEVLLGYDQGPLSSRPAAGVEGRLFYATDDGTLYYDMGTGWVPAGAQPGDVVWTARSETSRLGWLPCDGRSYSEASYQALSRAIGTFFGGGSGSFNVPDLCGRAPIGTGLGTGLTSRSLGDRPGVEAHVLSIDELPSHTHGITMGTAGSHQHGGATTVTSIAHAHQSQEGRPFLTDRVSVGGGVYDLTGGPDVGNGGGGWTATSDPAHAHGINPDGSHTHTLTPRAAGGGRGHSTMQPSLALNAWIKV